MFFLANWDGRRCGRHDFVRLPDWQLTADILAIYSCYKGSPARTNYYQYYQTYCCRGYNSWVTWHLSPRQWNFVLFLDRRSTASGSCHKQKTSEIRWSTICFTVHFPIWVEGVLCVSYVTFTRATTQAAALPFFHFSEKPFSLTWLKAQTWNKFISIQGTSLSTNLAIK